MSDNQITPFERNELGLSEPDSGGGGGGNADVASEFAGELVTATATGRRVSSTFIVLGAVLLASGVGLYAMRKVAIGAPAEDGTNAAERIVDEWFRNGGKIGNGSDTDTDTDSGFDDLLYRGDEDRLQVAMQNVQKNPFMILGVDGVAEETTVVPTGPTPAEILASEVSILGPRLELKSIIGGSNPAAIVNDQLLRIGHTLTFSNARDDRSNPVELTVTSIDPMDGVKLEFNDELLDGPIEFHVQPDAPGS